MATFHLCCNVIFWFVLPCFHFRLKQCLNQKLKNLVLKYTIDFVKTCKLLEFYYIFGNEVRFNKVT
jgi:hypothetical protein